MKKELEKLRKSKLWCRCDCGNVGRSSNLHKLRLGHVPRKCAKPINGASRPDDEDYDSGDDIMETNRRICSLMGFRLADDISSAVPMSVDNISPDVPLNVSLPANPIAQADHHMSVDDLPVAAKHPTRRHRGEGQQLLLDYRSTRGGRTRLLAELPPVHRENYVVCR
jgi:hypothetical protein